MEEKYLERAVELAEDALNSGNKPFGSVLFDQSGNVLFEDHNRVNTKNAFYHPEYAISLWALEHMTADARKEAVVYTSGEHCPMCSTSHALAGLGKIVYASSSEQLSEWLKEFGVGPSAFSSKSVKEMIPGIEVEGPHHELSERVKALHQRYYKEVEK